MSARLALCGLVMVAVCTSFQGVESASGRRTLLDDYIRATPGVPATVPFTSWPSAPPPTIAQFVEEEWEIFLAAAPANFQSLVATAVGFIPGFAGLPIGQVFNLFLPLINTAGTNLLQSTGAIPTPPPDAGQ